MKPESVVVDQPVAAAASPPHTATPVAPTEPAAAPADEQGQRSNHLLVAIVVILTLYTCAVAEAVLVPLLVAILFGLMLAPPVRLLERSRIPRVIGSLLMVVLTLAVVTIVISALASPARAWMERMPRAMDRIETVLRDVRRPLQAATEATRELGKLTDMGASQAPVRVVDSSPGPLAQMLSAAPAVLAGIVISIFLTFLFLLHGDDLLRKFVMLAPHLRAKRDLVEATRHAQRELSMYVITITLINMGLGLATAGALYLMHVHDPLLWGGVAAVLNFAPFIGPLLTMIALTVVGFTEFSSPSLALAVPAVFLGLHMIEGQLLTPHLVGRRMALDPVVVFLALVALGWMWGVAGLLLAVPLLTCAKIVAERMEDGHVLAMLLSRSSKQDVAPATNAETAAN
jgi:predicted PurR-regulated permease PerM